MTKPNNDPVVYLLSETARQFFSNNKLKDEYKLELKSCPVCNKNRFKKLFKLYEFKYILCKDCGFLFVNPRLSDKGSYLWYNSDYYNAALNSEYYINENIDRFHSVSLSGVERENAIQLLLSNGISKYSSILDLGCGGGSFIDLLVSQYGFKNVLGIDLNEQAVNFAANFRNLNVKQVNINEFSSDERFDVVVSIESIEHANDLEGYISSIKSHLQNKGFLLISTPHNDALARKYLGKFSDYYCAPNHLNYFNLITLKEFLKKYRFEVIDYKLDNTAPLNPLGIIKKWFFVPDQATMDPPNCPKFKKTPLRFSKDHKKYIEIMSIESGFDQKKNSGFVRTSSNKKTFKKLIKNYLQDKINLKFNHHMSVLAQLME